MGKKFGYRIDNFDLGKHGSFQYAKWMHPLELDKVFTEDLIDNYKKIISPNSTVIDIGAHTGDTSVVYSLATGEKGTVIAFEPNPYVFDILKENSILCNRGKIIPINMGVVNSPDKSIVELTFYYGDKNFCNGGHAEPLKLNENTGLPFPLKINCVDLQSWIKENNINVYDISFVKIDTEGYDKEILKGMKNIFNIHKPIIQFEKFPILPKSELIELYDTITELGYNIYDFSSYNLDIISKNPLDKEEFIKIPSLEIISLPKKN